MFQRRLITQAAVGPLLVIVAAPSLNLLCSILQAQKPVLIQALLSEPVLNDSMKALSVGLPGREKSYAMSVSPQVNFLGDELWAVVQTDALRHPILGHRQVESRDHVIAPGAESHPDKRTNTAKVIHYR